MTSIGRKSSPQNPLITDGFKLDGGLNFTDPKLFVEAGSLQDCLNYEVIDKIGYRRIDGFERYDGRLSPAIEDYFYIHDQAYAELIFADGFEIDFPNGGLLVIKGTTNIFGVILDTDPDTGRIYYARVNRDYEPVNGDTVQVLGGTGEDFTLDEDVGQGSLNTTLNATAKATIDNINTYSATLRSRIEDLHDTPIGLHWFRDRLYAVVDEQAIYFESGGTTELLPNQYIKGATSGATALVLHIQLKSGTWAGGDANGVLLIQKLNDTAFTTTENIDVFPTSAFSGVATTSNIATLRAQVTSGASIDPDPEYAGLWQSRTEQQAQTESSDADLAGWDKIDLGYEIEYSDGFSSSGELVKIEKGTVPNLIPQDSFTSVTGTDGTATFFIQAYEIDGYQVLAKRGWKSSQDALYIVDDATDLTSDDNNFVYADNWASWNNGGLPSLASVNSERPETNNITVDVGAGNVTREFNASDGRFWFTVGDFVSLASELPDNATITGVEVSIIYDAEILATSDTSVIDSSDAAFNAFDSISLEAALVEFGALKAEVLGSTQQAALDYALANFTQSENGTSSSGGIYDTYYKYTKNSESTITLGGAGDLFGATTISRNDLASGQIGLALHTVLVPATSNPGCNFGRVAYRMQIDKVQVKIYYTEPSVRYYFSDGEASPSIVQADLVYYTVDDGRFETSDASGTMQLANVQAYSGSADGRRTIQAGDTIHTVATVTAASQVGVVAAGSEMILNGLASRDDLEDNDSRYQFITANFYARDDWDGFYGVNGASRAFSFDGTYLTRITTNTLDVAEDKPRHIAFHHYHLALGFAAGIVRMSVPGEPENFDGTLGATEIGVGDSVTGLLSMRGMTLGVFCENSIWGITGTDADSFTTQVLAPSTGAVEYTVVDMGLPVFCDTRGISTLSQSEKYGDFMGERLSYNVTPWISKRMVRNNSLFSIADGAGVVCAIPVRSKNQYRVFFRDGFVLSMALNADGSPEFTFSEYYLGQTATTEVTKYLVPLAWSSQVDNKGVERIHVSHYSPFSAAAVALNKYVYELDRGWGFDGNFIPAQITTNWHYQEGPFRTNTIRKVRAEGLTRGYANLRLYTGADYSDDFSTESVDLSLPRNSLTTLSADFKPATNISNPAKRGRTIKLKIANEIPSGDTITDPQPPHVLQALLIQFTQGDEDA